MKGHHLVPFLLFVATALPAQFHEDFTGKTLDSAWTWSDPGNDCKYQLGAATGRLRMTVPPGNDHTTGHAAPLYSGPMLTIQASGDFVITTHVAINYPQTPNAMESGLMIWQDKSNNLQFKRTNAYNSQNVLYYGNIGSSQTTFHGNTTLSAKEVYLRIARSGADFTSYYSLDGKTWTKAGSVKWTVSGTLNVGISTSFWLWWGSTTNPTTGDYLFFDLQQPKPELAADRAGLSAVAGGTIGLNVDLGTTRAKHSYILVGSFTGNRPGTPLPGGLLPLVLHALIPLAQGIPGPHRAASQ